MIQQTLYMDTETVRKQLTMDRWAYDLIKSSDSESLTKGLVAYEAVMFSNNQYTDSLSQIESSVDDQLSTVASNSFLDSIQKIKICDKEVDTTDTDRLDYVNIHLPDPLITEIRDIGGIQRGLGDHIADAVYKLAKSAYTDRTDRIKVKQQLISYIQYDEYPSHDVAQAVVDGDDTVYSVSDAHNELQKITGEIEVWERDDLNKEDLLDEDLWGEIPETKSKRVEALQNVVHNEQMTESEVVDFVDQFNLSAPTRKSYVEELDYVHDVEIDAAGILSEIYKEEVTSDLDLRLRNHFSGPAEVATITDIDAYDNLDGTPLPLETAEQYIDSLTESYDDDLLQDGFKEKQMKIRSRLGATLRLQLDD